MAIENKKREKLSGFEVFVNGIIHRPLQPQKGAVCHVRLSLIDTTSQFFTKIYRKSTLEVTILLMGPEFLILMIQQLYKNLRRCQIPPVMVFPRTYASKSSLLNLPPLVGVCLGNDALY